VRDVRLTISCSTRTAAIPPPAIFNPPYLQVSQPFFLTRMTFIVRTDAEPRAVATMMQPALHAADGNLAPHPSGRCRR
jgi:hypothetical protein